MAPSAPRCHMSLQIDQLFVAPHLVKTHVCEGQACAKSHASIRSNRRMPWPIMEDAVTDWSFTVFKRYARGYCSDVPLSGTCEAVVPPLGWSPLLAP